MTRQTVAPWRCKPLQPVTHRLFAQQAKTPPILSAQVLEIILAFSQRMFFQGQHSVWLPFDISAGVMLLK
jgi:hypothetical protein